jgi:hypothetical protein
MAEIVGAFLRADNPVAGVGMLAVALATPQWTGGHRQAILNPEIREYGLEWGVVVADRSVRASQKPAGTYVINFGVCN